jgi:histidyl-tRNA synthetase
MAKIQAIRGMNDILPDETPTWQYLEQCFQAVARRYAYREIRFPILEQTKLFKRSIGEATDIVEKEMYSFDDRSGDNLSLRPEGTAGCVRAADQSGLLYNQQQRLWYQGPMFRHERPQKGRLRQFHQFGIEAFGLIGPDIDAEVILLSAQLWQELGLSDGLILEINNIGSAQDRRTYGAELVTYLNAFKERLDPDSQRRLDSNPLRILDSKIPQTREILEHAPLLADYVNQSSRDHYGQLKQLLQESGLAFQENSKLVRGLDYYNNAVFEWTTKDLGAQGTVCAGGRYDGLVEQLGGKPTPAVGFAIGEERLVLLLEEKGAVPGHITNTVDVFLAIVGDNLINQGIQLAQALRQDNPDLCLQVNCGGGKYKNQMKKAYNSGAKIAVIMEQDLDDPSTPLEQVKLRMLTDSATSESVPVKGLSKHLERLLTS